MISTAQSRTSAIGTRPEARLLTHSTAPSERESMSSNGPPSSTRAIDYLENGRMYHGFRKGIYMYPCDETEKDRMDIYHQLFLVARRQELHRARIEQNVGEVRILDLGTGTGIWAIDVADLYPEAEVVGLDLVNIQPHVIPRNLRFRVPRDYESPSWSLGEDSWDLIHVRQACGSVSSWPELYQKIFLHLKPGYGCIEQVEIDLQPRCDDGTLPYSPTVLWYDKLKEATTQASRSIEYQQNTRQMLETAGFIDIQEQVIRAPFNSWSKDSHQKQVGRWYCVGLSEGLEALSMAPFTRVFGWSPTDVKRLTEDVKACIMTRKIHAYNNIPPALKSFTGTHMSLPGLANAKITRASYQSGPMDRKIEIKGHVQYIINIQKSQGRHTPGFNDTTNDRDVMTSFSSGWTIRPGQASERVVPASELGKHLSIIEHFEQYAEISCSAPTYAR